MMKTKKYRSILSIILYCLIMTETYVEITHFLVRLNHQVGHREIRSTFLFLSTSPLRYHPYDNQVNPSA